VPLDFFFVKVVVKEARKIYQAAGVFRFQRLVPLDPQIALLEATQDVCAVFR